MKYIRYSVSGLNIETHPHLKFVDKYWRTADGKYDILYDEVNGYKHLRVRRIDDQPIHNYMDLQEIKNDLLGEDVVAVEIYPKKSDFRNGSNTYHIWTWGGLKTPNLNDLYQYNKLN